MLARVVRNSGHEHGGGGGFRAVPAYEDEAYSRLYSDRRSADSGHGGSVDQESSGYGDEDHGLEWVGEKSARGRWWVDLATLENALSASVPGIFNERVVKICNLVYSVIARFLIPLGFTQICLGIVTGAGIFVSCSARMFREMDAWMVADDESRWAAVCSMGSRTSSRAGSSSSTES